MESLKIGQKFDFKPNSESEIIAKIKGYGLQDELDLAFHQELHLKSGAIERERKILLNLSEELTNIRDKGDLTALFSSVISDSFGFGHISVNLINPLNLTYLPFCFSTDSNVDHEGSYAAWFDGVQHIDASFFSAILDESTPRVFDIEDIKDLAESPNYLEEYYQSGMVAGMTAPLKNKMEIMGFIEIYAKDKTKFSKEFLAIISGILPQVANVISNIILNEEISQKTALNEKLITLSNDLVSVRHKKDLLNVLNEGLRSFFTYSHSAIILINDTPGYYTSFLSEQKITEKDLSKFNDALSQPNELADVILGTALNAPNPIVLDAKTVDLRDSPLWYRFNFSLGIRETLVKVLPGNESTKFALMFFSQQSGTFNEQSISIIERISDQLSSVVRNIDTNERLRAREIEKTFLLDFSNDIAGVTKKEELSAAVKRTLKKLDNPVKMYAITTINSDWKTMSCYFHDTSTPAILKNELQEIEKAMFPIHDGIQDRILANAIPLLLNIDLEAKRETVPKYVNFWNNMGFENVVGTALRTGNTDLGIFWVASDEVKPALLKGICAQISIALSNIIANEQLLKYKRMLEIENDDLQEQIRTFYNFSEIIGSGNEMRKIYNLINIVAPSDTTVMVNGETGTGKELIARAIHNSSPRNGKLMVKVNCAALPANLIESELFGHEKGSFTGAYEKRIGKFELAHEGTIFLDEIGEMPLELQVKLLRVLQEREFERIGGKETIRVNVRIIAATNRDLTAEVAAGRFRSDLFYRLNVFPMQLPPLRARLEDIEPLVNFFIERYSKLTGFTVNSTTPAVLQRLRGYSWPGNIRELEHLIERSILLSKDEVLREIDLPNNPPEIQSDQWAVVYHALHDAERVHILNVLKGCAGKISGEGGAADLLDLPASTLHSKMKKLGIARTHYANG
jgi:formate hydrogenlyase transcriptional activator